MTPLQKSILNAVKRRPMTLREMQNNLQAVSYTHLTLPTIA